MAVPDFDTSRNRECMECHRAGFDEGDWQFMGYNDEAELYICPDCQSLAMADGGDVQTRVAEQRDEAEMGAECPYCNDTHVLIDGDEERICWNCYDFEP